MSVLRRRGTVLLGKSPSEYSSRDQDEMRRAIASAFDSMEQITGAVASGVGTIGKLPKWLTATELTDSILSESGSTVTVAGTLNATTLGGTLSTVTQNSVTTMTGLTTIGTLVAGAVPASLVTAGTFGAGAYTFPSTLVVTTTLTQNGTAASLVQGATGAVTVGANASTETRLQINGATGTLRQLVYFTAGSFRWNLYAASTAEAGSDAGSPLRLAAYTDSGVFIDNVVDITRATGGAISFTRPVVINENGANFDTRIEGDVRTHTVFLDASEDNLALCASSAPAWNSMQGGVFVANAIAVPTGNPTAGGYLYVEGGALKYRGSSGTITTIGAA